MGSSSYQELVKHLPDEWSSDDEAEVTEKDIIKNYCLLHEKWLAVIEKNQKLRKNIVNLKLKKNDLEKKVSDLTIENDELIDTMSDLNKQCES